MRDGEDNELDAVGGPTPDAATEPTGKDADEGTTDDGGEDEDEAQASGAASPEDPVRHDDPPRDHATAIPFDEFARVMASSRRRVLRRVLADHPTAPVVSLRELLSTYPMLGALTLGELFGPASPVDRNNDWGQSFVEALERGEHDYDSLHRLVDCFYLAAVLREHKTIAASARHLKVSRARLRARLHAAGRRPEAVGFDETSA